MARTCWSCGEAHGFEIVAPGDLERSFDFDQAWGGLRLLCPGCGALLRVSFRSVSLTNEGPPGFPARFRVMAKLGAGPEVVPFPTTARHCA